MWGWIITGAGIALAIALFVFRNKVIAALPSGAVKDAATKIDYTLDKAELMAELSRLATIWGEYGNEKNVKICTDMMAEVAMLKVQTTAATTAPTVESLQAELAALKAQVASTTTPAG